MSLAKTTRLMQAVKPYSAPRWDHHMLWQHKVLDGSLPPVPAACRGADPVHIWPKVEGKLGYGIGKRRALFLMRAENAHFKSFKPPSWWQIQDAQQGMQTYCQETYKPLEVLWKPAKPREDGSFVLAKDKVLRFVVTIDGREPGMNEGIAFYLAAIGK